jgi:hypothetical protein
MAVACTGCATTRIEDPRQAAAAYADAARRGDADAIYGMMDERGRRALSRSEVRRIVSDERAELIEQSKSIAAAQAAIRSYARVRYADGEDATLVVNEQGAFRISSADALPAGARTPEQALDQLRTVLARRSYAGLLRVLSPATRSAVESDLRAIVAGLKSPDSLDLIITGDAASVQLPGGHEVKLRRSAGLWQVEDFD